MNDEAEWDCLPASPYPGIEPFTYAHRDVFFAREYEARALLQLVVVYRGVLLYSESGVGKSSLVNAGLIPQAIAEGYHPERLRVQPRKGQEIIVERLSVEATGKAKSLPTLFAGKKPEQDLALSIEEFMDTLRQKAGPARPLLIFDQFEEWITLFEEGDGEHSTGELRQMQQAILEALVALLNARQLPVKLLIVLREDYLAQLTPLFERCPTLVDQYLRLTPLVGEQVFRTIRGPFDGFPGKYKPEISPDLAQTIRNQFEERTRGADIRLTEVQIVCRSLFESKAQGSNPDQLFAELENVQGVLEEYLESALASLPTLQQEPAVVLLTRMVTSAGTRKRISQEDLLAQMKGEEFQQETVEAALNSLEHGAKLVRREPLRNVYYYEIASEFLVAWIQRQAEAQRLQKAQTKAASEARTRAEEEGRKRELEHTRRSNRRLALLAAALAISVLVALGLAGLFVAQSMRATREQHAAQTSEAEAVAARRVAEAGATVVQDSLQAQVVLLEKLLTQSPAPTTEQLTNTPMPTATGLATPGQMPAPSSTPLAASNMAATAAARALEAQLVSVRATQTKVAQLVLPAHSTVVVPDGCFLQGSMEAQTTAAFTRCSEFEPESEPSPGKFCSQRMLEDEWPQHKVCLNGFYIDQYEVTNAQYEACVQAGPCSPPKSAESHGQVLYFGVERYADYPVIYVSWHDAEVYCEWVGMRLPTEAEWERAARGDSGAEWPWGHSFADDMCNTRPRGVRANAADLDTQPVGSYPACKSPYGAMDMIGNVWEWVADWYDEGYYTEQATDNPLGPPPGDFKAARGGSWNTNAGLARAALRTGVVPVRGFMDFGFRCASDR